MLDCGRVLWKEGMFLEPQHFQISDLLLEGRVSNRIVELQPYSFGFSLIEIDHKLLENDIFSIKRCKGIFPDGTWFNHISENDSILRKNFSGFCSPETQRLDVFLTLADRKNFEVYSSVPKRYRSRYFSISDEFSDSGIKEIEFGIPDYQITFGNEAMDGCTSLKIAVLQRSRNGKMEIDNTFIPALLSIGASGYLLELVSSVLEVLIANVNQLSMLRKETSNGISSFSSSDENSFRLMYALCSGIPLLNQYFQSRCVHPFTLFSHLLFILGSLKAFDSKLEFDRLVLYKHGASGEAFRTVIEKIVQILNAGVSSGCEVLNLEQSNASSYYCQYNSSKLRNYTMYLGVSAKTEEKELIISVLQRLKVCSRENLELLITSALPGLPLIHAKWLPENLPSKQGFIYFTIEKDGHLWKSIEASRTIGVYFPNRYENLQIELIALKDR